MALDQKEIDNIVPKSVEISQPGVEVPGREKAPVFEQSKVESGAQIESGGMPGGSERVLPAETASPQPITPPSADPDYQRYKKIEQVLESDLGELYNNLTPQEQKLFKIKGEETARSIFQLLYHQTKINVKKIIKLIKNWLKMIPGINKFFLEQEAKIKADQIVAMASEDKKVKF